MAGRPSASGSLSTLSWAATGYGYDNQAVGETRLTLPLGESINVNLQNMLASDSSWSSVGSISATLPGGFSSVWVNQERTRIGDQLRRSDADNRAIGGTLNLNALWSKLGTFSVSYNDDRRYNSHYYTADYYQTVYSGAFGSLGLRAGSSAITMATAAPTPGNISPSICLCRWVTGSAPG
ncbi:CFA/I fimbrial subunit C usher protein [Klebsiella pneumoniae]|uniref:CFA/I fimbrial subunit C usher protein n=1 Tax=Klebsiella pneumoniae TaxID=573 RepID=A0A377TLF5_KLEPN|nr:CFA/I fimbrial subunit C usher protein [Klebsiella pneumoniae]